MYAFDPIDALHRRESCLRPEETSSLVEVTQPIDLSTANLKSGHYYVGFWQDAPGLVFLSRSQALSIVEDTPYFDTCLSVSFDSEDSFTLRGLNV